MSLHFVFEVLGYLTGVAIYALTARADPHPAGDRATALTGAALGAAVGSRLLAYLSYGGATFVAGKTVVGGLLGGLIGVEIAKKLSGITRSTGDRFTFPIIAAIAIGRIGCFLTGPADKTAGLPTSLPWGIAMGDTVKRHPVALYEIAFLALLALVLWKGEGRRAKEGDRFRIFLASYLAFRLAVDFLKPDPPAIPLGLSAIQWACVAGLLYYGLVFANDDRHASLPFLRRRRVDLHDVLSED